MSGHIHKGPGEHDQTISAYIIRTDTGGEPAVMMHMHKRLKKWLQYGGHIELKETPWQTMCHEILEETGYEMDQLRILQPRVRIKKLAGNVIHPIPINYITHPFPGLDHFHTDIGLAFVTDEPPRQPVAANEAAETRLFVATELANPPADAVADAFTIAHFALTSCLPEWEQVPTSTFY